MSQFKKRYGPGRGTLRIFGWGCAAGTSALAYTRPIVVQENFANPYKTNPPKTPCYPRVEIVQKLLKVTLSLLEN